jgi:hypothetical protein
LAASPTVTVVTKPAGIHFGDRRGEHHGAAGAGQKLGVAGLLTRIGAQILVGRELGRVDEDAGHDPVRAASGLGDQGQVTIVQGAHGGNQTDRQTLLSPVPDNGAQFAHGADDRQGLRVFGDGYDVNPSL